MVKKFLHRLRSSEFNRNVAKVFTGNIAGSIIYALSIPVIARIFDKAAFGDFQLLFSVVAVFTPVVSLRFEKSIILGNSQKEIEKSFVLSFFSLGVSLFVLVFAFAFWGKPLLTYLKAGSISSFYPLILCSVFLEGVLVILSELTIKEKRITELSFNKALALTLYGILPIALSVISKSFAILFISRIIAYIIGILYFIIKIRPFRYFRFKNLNDIIYWARYNSKFPLFNVPATFINTISIEMPVFMLFRAFGAETVGLYSMAYRLIQMPMSLVEGAITDIYYREAAETYNHKGDLMRLYQRTLMKLAAIAILPVIVLPFLPFLIGLFLSPQWIQAGKYIQILYPFIFFSFLNSSIAGTLVVLRRQELGLILISISIVVRYLSMKFFSATPITMLLAFSISSALFYIAYNFTVYLSIRKAMHEKTPAKNI